ncbi:hypothetical protein [Nevskia soli]|jgi:hypothetical protein|uniref:hypothetical protein n=1 Tax=Nevskia soli TaxID=418856 RepID=UPI0015D842CC|nr:hypothetical protein [Nevskia soli]
MSTNPLEDLLPLASRYQAAWAEHGIRVSERQSVINMYLTVVAVLYGFWFTSKEGETLATFLVVAVTALTASSSALIYMHNRVLQRLTGFMRNCENCASQSIRDLSKKGADVFYPYDEGSQEV